MRRRVSVNGSVSGSVFSASAHGPQRGDQAQAQHHRRAPPERPSAGLDFGAIQHKVAISGHQVGLDFGVGFALPNQVAHFVALIFGQVSAG